jgi:hypothetical protein
MYVCMYVCMYIHIYIYIFMYMYIYKCMYAPQTMIQKCTKETPPLCCSRPHPPLRYPPPPRRPFLFSTVGGLLPRERGSGTLSERALDFPVISDNERESGQVSVCLLLNTHAHFFDQISPSFPLHFQPRGDFYRGHGGRGLRRTWRWAFLL